jgi:outer membrane protein OmpA-like peptidoglycan-associated protein
MTKRQFKLFLPQCIQVSVTLGGILLLMVSCQNPTAKENAKVEEDPLTAIEAMVNETKAIAEAEEDRVDEKTIKTLDSLEFMKFDPGSAPERLYLAIRAGKKLRQEVFLFKTLNFEKDKADAMPAMQTELSQLAKIMKAFPAFKFEIAAHTQGIGDPILNLTLSQDRATAILEALAKLGIAPARMRATGYGDELPIADSAMPEGRLANERVELTFLK